MMRCNYVSVAVLCMASGVAYAQSQGASPAQRIYTCKDAAGHVLTSDRPIPECADRPMEERSRQGTVLREIPAPLTPAQQQQADLEARRRKEMEEADREQKFHDRALLATYSDEKSLEAARARALADSRDALNEANERMAQLLADRAANNKEAQGYQKTPVPVTLQRRIDENEIAIASEERTIADRKADIDRVNARFDRDLQRFRVLTTGSSSSAR